MVDPSPAPLPQPEPSLTRTIALVGLMGVGKTSLGRRLAAMLGVAFKDADEEIENAAGCSVSEIFSARGEAEFRAGERRVIARLLEGPPHVLATGGGAFTQKETRALINQKAVSVWLRADLAVLARRVARKSTRPLLIGRDPLDVLTAQMRDRYPFYAEAHVTIDTGDLPHTATLTAVMEAVRRYQAEREPPSFASGRRAP
jgi:shikimate kinase